MVKCKVSYAARKVGALGVVSTVSRTVEASNCKEAKDKVFDLLHEQDYETFHCIVIEVLSDNDEIIERWDPQQHYDDPQ